MNKTIEIQKNHKTIREFKNDHISKEIMEELLEVARRTATSNGMQTYSIIRITNKAIKEKISKLCNQEYIARAPELLIFIVDQYRNSQISTEKGLDFEYTNDMDKFFQGFTDSSLAAQNMVVAAESLKLGTNYLGSILNNVKEICSLLELPKLTFPVVGLSIGYPNQEPQLKPRMEMSLRVFENKYIKFSNYLEKLENYDREMQSYYDLRDANKRVDSFTDQVKTKSKLSLEKRKEILNAIKDQGFNLMIKEV
ncbi:MAG: NADPH-dependent oxidoreductase [Gudongella sp.]|nr:NADPH-dependent oxidoreductase [Gudongella sp.]